MKSRKRSRSKNKSQEKALLVSEGTTTLTAWGKTSLYFFALDLPTGRLLAFVSPLQTKPNKQISLSGFLITTITDHTLTLRRKNRNLRLQVHQDSSLQEVMVRLERCFQVKAKASPLGRFTKAVSSKLFTLFKMPFVLTRGVLHSLEKVSQKSKDPFKRLSKTPTKKVNNPLSGMLLGAGSMLKQILLGVSGVFYEPIKGAKAGVKGIGKGIGKGLVGLIFKPVAGTIDVVTCTARGMETMGGKVYSNMFRIRKANKKTIESLQQEEEAPHEETLVFQDDEMILYCNDSTVRQQIQQAIGNEESVLWKDIRDKQNHSLDSGHIDKLIDFYQQEYNQDKENICEFVVIQPQDKPTLNLDRLDTHDRLKHTKSELIDSPILDIPRDTPKRIHGLQSMHCASGFMPPTLGIQSVPAFLSRPSPLTPSYHVSKWIQSMPPPDPPQPHSPSPEELARQHKIKEQKKERALDRFYKMGPVQKVLSSTRKQKFDRSQVLMESAKEYNTWDIETLEKYRQDGPSLRQDDTRPPDAPSKGGRQLTDTDQTNLIRKVAKQTVAQVGKNILSGSVGIQNLSFPIECNSQSTSLQLCHASSSFFPFFIRDTPCPVDRLQQVVLAIMAGLSSANSFCKPLVPFLGETHQCCYLDGTQLYSEQVQPSITFFLAVHPLYRYWGYYNNSASAGLNSLKISNSGKRHFLYQHSGQLISFDFGGDTITNCFMGTIRSQASGEVVFRDKAGGLECRVALGKHKGKPTDYFEAPLVQGQQQHRLLWGSYLGYLYVDQRKVWDYRDITPFSQLHQKRILHSDSLRRPDLQHMLLNEYSKAQLARQRLEEKERAAGRLREEGKGKEGKGKGEEGKGEEGRPG